MWESGKPSKPEEIPEPEEILSFYTFPEPEKIRQLEEISKLEEVSDADEEFRPRKRLKTEHLLEDAK
jgi:hypothetical protein